MGLESRRVHLIKLSHGTITFGFLTVLHFWYFDLWLEDRLRMLPGKGRGEGPYILPGP